MSNYSTEESDIGDIFARNTDSFESNKNVISETCKRRVSYMYNPAYLKICNEFPKVSGRAALVHSLIASYGLFNHMTCVSASPASEADMAVFHSHDYLACLARLSAAEDGEGWLEEEEAELYGFTYDCPAYGGVYEYSQAVGGASLAAAQSLVLGIADVAINWGGGWHHARRDEAAGFCYVNDAVLAALRLREKYERVLYVDLDLHHGDGVEDAFCATSKVLTVSFHKAAPGFFPGTGLLNDVGMSKGRYYSVNVPLKDGASDHTYCRIFEEVMSAVFAAFRPEACVCQCGADGLAGDPMATYNLTLHGVGRCVTWLLGRGLPTVLLGGGGYNYANTARCWAYLTSLALGEELPLDIPEHRHFPDYGPTYELHIEAGNRQDLNDEPHLQHVLHTVRENLNRLPGSESRLVTGMN